MEGKKLEEKKRFKLNKLILLFKLILFVSHWILWIASEGPKSMWSPYMSFLYFVECLIKYELGRESLVRPCVLCAGLGRLV